ncbi:methyltransferase domain-containing protein [Streptomyces sp. YGL11-2]|uniref:methyltransferase domain-containing protein n=1 Tax=Streptomyces sp. YGL11-2 TaxID=3414028 RepID=UPI003CE71DBA
MQPPRPRHRPGHPATQPPSHPATQPPSQTAYSDAPLVTQLTFEDDGFQQPTSSASAPSNVIRMLRQADLADGQTVLEIGTTTGYHAAPLNHRLGAAHVTSIEVDETVTEQARTNLTTSGHQATVITDDGAHLRHPHPRSRRRRHRRHQHRHRHRHRHQHVSPLRRVHGHARAASRRRR